MGGPNHFIQHVPSEKPTEIPQLCHPLFPFGVKVLYGVDIRLVFLDEDD